MLEIRVPDSLSCVHNDVQNLRGLITGETASFFRWFFVEKYSFFSSLGFLKNIELLLEVIYTRSEMNTKRLH